MINSYTATQDSLDFIITRLNEHHHFSFDDTSIEEFKTAFIDGIKRNSTGFWNPWDGTGDEDNIVSDEFTIYKYNTSDNKVRLRKHVADEFANSKLQEFNWLDTSGNPKEIDYKINRHGFRCNNFTADPGIIFVGCSNTYGTGLSQSDTWPTLVSSYFNVESWNLGLPGMSLTLNTFFLANWYSDIPNPTAIVVLEPPPDRVEIHRINHNKFRVDILKTMLDNFQRNVLNVLTNRLYTGLPLTSAINYRNNIQTLKLLAKASNIPFINCTLFPGSSNQILGINANDFARDLMHFGKGCHSQIAEHYIQALKNQGL